MCDDECEVKWGRGYKAFASITTFASLFGPTTAVRTRMES